MGRRTTLQLYDFTVLYDFKITRVGQKISLQYIISQLAEELYSSFSKKKDSVPWTQIDTTGLNELQSL